MKATLLNPDVQGPDLVLIHGYGADSFTWLATTPALIDRARLWLLDLPGHGRSDVYTGPGSLPDLCHLLDMWLRQQALTSVHLLGHSLGGRLAMEYGSRHPDRVHSLFLVSPAGIGGAVNHRFLQAFHEAGSDEDMSRLLVSLVHDRRLISRGLANRVIEFLNKPDRRAGLARIAAGLQEAQSAVPMLMSAVADLPFRRCIVWGNEDRINTPAPAMISALPADWHLLSHCGHLPHLERSTLVNRLLREFIGADVH